MGWEVKKGRKRVDALYTTLKKKRAEEIFISQPMRRTPPSRKSDLVYSPRSNKQCLAKSLASVAVQSPLDLSFRLSHHALLPISGEHASRTKTNTIKVVFMPSMPITSNCSSSITATVQQNNLKPAVLHIPITELCQLGNRFTSSNLRQPQHRLQKATLPPFDRPPTRGLLSDPTY